MLVDLTLDMSETLPVFPGSPPMHMIPWSTIRGEGYNSEMLFLSSHLGTHMDAPYHFVQDGLRIHQIPLDVLMGRATLLNIQKKANEYIQRDDIVRWQRDNHKIPHNSPVIFYTGWQAHINHDYYFTENPGLSRDAADYLASISVPLVGTDLPSIDAGRDSAFPAHHILARKGTVNVENLANLDKIQYIEFNYIILPLKIRNATGSPVRAMAILE
ncbi:MAG: cyclase family protein [Cenarchaeum sp. SB0662_bin_33]|nr:cyclase family protein [Cenarchaeum sp. SB0662_bin_33]